MAKEMGFITWLVGEEGAIRLRIRKPKHVSPNNKVVFGYVDSVDGALREGQLDIDQVGFYPGDKGNGTKSTGEGINS